MSEEKVTPLDRFAAPYNREVRLHDVVYESGMRLLRVTVKEGRRITILDVDAAFLAANGDKDRTGSVSGINHDPFVSGIEHDRRVGGIRIQTAITEQPVVAAEGCHTSGILAAHRAHFAFS